MIRTTTRRAGFRVNRLFLVFVILACGVFIFHHGHARPRPRPHNAYYSAGKVLDFSNLPPANSTLGFGAIAAVSKTNSTRRNGLLLAANITELDITIPDQPAWTDEDVLSVKAAHGSRLNRGSALAWLGHLNMLRWFLSTNLSTILILEDDVDWDIHLRTVQVPKVAATIRYLLSSSSASHIQAIHDPESAGGYWSGTNNWDVLYLGHCGDAIKPGKWNFRTQRAGFYDDTLPPRKIMEKKTRRLLKGIALPHNLRVVHQSVQPLCTFGFALTRATAEKLLHDIAPKEEEGGTLAYDVRVLEACRDKGLRCWSSTPELFHHMHAASEIAIANGNVTYSSTSSGVPSRTSSASAATATGKEENEDDDNDDDDEDDDDASPHLRQTTGDVPSSQQDPLTPPPPPSKGKEKGKDKKGGKKGKKGKKSKEKTPDRAPNIACGARWFRAKDEAEMERVRQVVGREGRCVRQWQEKETQKG
ncbi:glycosyltransferase family 25 protein [Myriangium duriaei CBS 260.36]|uniref:Glycosyltransferase family 25 protein n=1 Tax=Myriangium duriaei CBS 260.36 TaxID=1168546 RepID=A0A9P4MRD8_9PEZI|nr:glycosyltransferase family 25 protein [Myriangium duriaei CBS 260.36]